MDNRFGKWICAALVAVALVAPAALAQQVPYGPTSITTITGAVNCTTPGNASARVSVENASTASIDVQGAFTGNMTFRYSNDGITFNQVPAAQPQNTGTVVTATTVPGRFVLNVAGWKQLCVDNTLGWTSGSATVILNASAGSVGPAVATAANLAAPIVGGIATMVAPVGAKAVTSIPAVTTAASAAIGGTGNRHVSLGCLVSISTVVAQPDIIAQIRDGATVIGVCRMTCAISSPCSCLIPASGYPGVVSNALTCETTTAPAAGNFATASLWYFDAN